MPQPNLPKFWSRDQSGSTTIPSFCGTVTKWTTVSQISGSVMMQLMFLFYSDSELFASFLIFGARLLRKPKVPAPTLGSDPGELNG